MRIWPFILRYKQEFNKSAEKLMAALKSAYTMNQGNKFNLLNRTLGRDMKRKCKPKSVMNICGSSEI
jgi:hypothetical protein